MLLLLPLCDVDEGRKMTCERCLIGSWTAVVWCWEDDMRVAADWLLDCHCVVLVLQSLQPCLPRHRAQRTPPSPHHHAPGTDASRSESGLQAWLLPTLVGRERTG